MIYTLRNPKTGETITVEVNSEIEENDIRMYAAVCGWDIVNVE